MQSLKDAFFSVAYLFSTRTLLASRLADALCVRDDWEIDANMPRIRRLLRARPDLSGEDGQFALSRAVIRHSDEAVRLLLDAGVPPDVPRDDGKTQLAVAAIWGLYNAAVMLLDKGADVNHADNNGMTPLMLAANCQPEMVGLLLARGANLDLRDAQGRTALDVSMQPAQNSGLAERHEQCLGLIRTAKETRDRTRQEHEDYLGDGMPTTRTVAVVRPPSLRRRGA